MPPFSAMEDASPTDSIVTAMRKLPISLTRLACGASPKGNVPRPSAAKRGWHRSRSDCSPPQTIQSCFFCAASGRPNTGAETNRWPAERCASRSLRESATEMVLIERWMAPGRSPATSPSSPKVTRSAAASSATMLATMPQGPATSRGEAPSIAPAGALPGVRFQTRTTKPAATRFAAIWLPILPSPMNPTVSTWLPAEERLEARAQRSADQRPVDSPSEAVRLRAVRVVPEGGETEALQVDVAYFAQVAQAVLPVNAPQAARLHSTPRRLGSRMRVERVVVHHRAGEELVGDAIRFRLVAREHVCRQAIGRIVGQPHGLVVGAEGHDGQHRAEGLVPHDGHLVGYVREHGRLHVPAAVRSDFHLAAREYLRASLARVVQVPPDDVHLHLRRPGADVDVVAVRLSLPQPLRQRDDLLRERRGDALVDVHALDGRARLARVREGSPGYLRGGAVQIGIREHDGRILATQLEHAGNHLLRRR